MPRVRARRLKALIGPDLSPAEELELMFGPHPVRGSVFPDAARRRAAAAAFAVVTALRAESARKLMQFFARAGHDEGRLAWELPESVFLYERAIGYLESAQDGLAGWLQAGRQALAAPRINSSTIGRPHDGEGEVD